MLDGTTRVLKRRVMLHVPGMSGRTQRLIAEVLYLVVFALYALAQWMYLTAYKSTLDVAWVAELLGLAVNAALVIMPVCYVLGRHTVSEILCVVAVACLLWFGAGDAFPTDVFVTFLFVVAARDDYARPLSAVMLVVLCAVGYATIMGWRLGIVGDVTLPAAAGRPVRHSYGFMHPNSLALWLFMVSLTFLSVRGWKVHIVDSVAVLPCWYASHTMTHSRTVDVQFALMEALLVVVLLSRSRFASLRRVSVYILQHLPQLLAMVVLAEALGTAYALVAYDPSQQFWLDLDKILSGRIQFAAWFYQDAGLSLTCRAEGQLLQAGIIRGGLILDNTYARMFLLDGIVSSAVAICSAFVTLLGTKSAEKHPVWCIGLATMLPIAVSELTARRMGMNYFLAGLVAMRREVAAPMRRDAVVVERCNRARTHATNPGATNPASGSCVGAR